MKVQHFPPIRSLSLGFHNVLQFWAAVLQYFQSHLIKQCLICSAHVHLSQELTWLSASENQLLFSPHSHLSWIRLFQGYPEVNHCHVASGDPTDIMRLFHNLWRPLFLLMRYTINLCSAEFHGSVCLLRSRSTKTNHSSQGASSLCDVVPKNNKQAWHHHQTGGAPASVRQESKGLSSLAILAHTENLNWDVTQQQPRVPEEHWQQARPLPYD